MMTTPLSNYSPLALRDQVNFVSKYCKMYNIYVFYNIVVTRAETSHIWHHRAFNIEKRLFTTPEGTVVAFSDLRRIVSEQFEEKMANMALLQSLDLTHEETVLLGCLAILSPGKCQHCYDFSFYIL